MNINEYGEVINGNGTYKDIAYRLKVGETVGIGWTDEEFTHYDIVFKLGLDTKVGSFQRGIRPNFLFVSILSMTSYGFVPDSIKNVGYIQEKLGRADYSTEKVAELINGIIGELINGK